ncbi:PKD domain-containing protein [Candidatus Bipolaricaulota bacterium]|nr:PKD domain-containing protein [Candidatus Bipolaricaulota bacterium]
MSRKWIALLLMLVLIGGLMAYSAHGSGSEKSSVTVKIRNTECDQLNISQFSFIKDNRLIGVKRVFPPRTVKRNQLTTVSFDLSVAPTQLVINGNRNGKEFSHRVSLNWGTNEKEVPCGRLTVVIPYKGGLDYPVARFEWDPGQPRPGERVKFDAGQSVGKIEDYVWDFDSDGEPDRWTGSPVIYHRWNSSGRYRVTLTVRDKSGKEAKASNTLRVSSAPEPEPSTLPDVKSFSCREHGYFSKDNSGYVYLEDTYSPPHDNCWGHYKSHIYPLEEFIKTPIILSKITAKVTGGISEKREVIDDFKLQVLDSPNSSWRTLKDFAAPCAAGGKGTLVQWEARSGAPVEAIAVRIRSGGRTYVDSSALWIEYHREY